METCTQHVALWRSNHTQKREDIISIREHWAAFVFVFTELFVYQNNLLEKCFIAVVFQNNYFNYTSILPIARL